ncbi:MAG: 6-carboxytetrahydropterin synthase QueD [bacterium]|jgi:6-pyruvoyltetrahydropterin/6-carboxytetrahydropterin synthase
MYEIVVERSFAGAHFLPEYPGKCRNMHGHNYHVRVYLRGAELDRFGMLADFGAVKATLDSVLERFDHRCLNELPEFADIPPSTEHLARTIAESMAQRDFAPARIHRVEVWETAIQAATYYLP